MVVDEIIKYTLLVLQLVDETANYRAMLVQMPVKKKAFTGKKRYQSRAIEVIAMGNHKMDELYR